MRRLDHGAGKRRLTAAVCARAPIRAAAALVGVAAFGADRGRALTEASAGRRTDLGVSSARSMANR